MKKIALLCFCVSLTIVLGSCSKEYGCYYSTLETKEVKTDTLPSFTTTKEENMPLKHSIMAD